MTKLTNITLSAILLLLSAGMTAFGQDKISRADLLYTQANNLSKKAEQAVARKANVPFYTNFTLITIGAKQATDLRAAIAKFDEASRLFPDENHKIVCLGMMGHLYRVLGDTPNSVKFLLEAVALTKERNQGFQPLLLSEIGFAYDDGGYETEALNHYKRAVLENADYWKGENGSYLLGITFRFIDLLATISDFGVYADVIEVQKQIISIADRLSSEEKYFLNVKMYALAGLGKNYTELGLFDQAIESYKQALEINKEYKEPFIDQNLANNIGIIYLRLGSLSDAKKYVQDALDLAKKYKKVLAATKPKGKGWKQTWQYNLDLITKWTANMGAVYTRLKQYEPAAKNFDETLPQFRTMRLRQLANRARLDAINTTAFMSVSSYYYGKVLREQNKIDEAIRLHNEALRFARESDLPKYASRSLVELGLDHLATNQPQAALEKFEEAFVLAHSRHIRDEEIASLDGLMQACDTLKQPSLAIFFGKQAINLLQSTRTDIQKLGKEAGGDFIKDNDSTYRKLAAILISEGRLNEALQVANLARDQEFFDIHFSVRQPDQIKQVAAQVDLTPREVAGVNSLLPKPNEVEDSAPLSEAPKSGAAGDQPGSVNSGPAEVKAISAKDTKDLQLWLREIKANFIKAAPAEDLVKSRLELSHFKNDECRPRQEYLSGSVSDVEELKYTLCELEKESKAKRFAAIYTLSLEDKFYVLLVTRNTVKAFSHPTSATKVKDTVDGFLDVLSCPRFDPRERSAELYDVIFKSTSTDGQNNTLEAELKKQQSQVLLWSLDGTLRYIPVGALYDETAQRYLVETYESAVFTRANSERFLRQPVPWIQGIGFGVSKSSLFYQENPDVRDTLLTIFDNGEKQVVLDDEFTAEALTGLQGKWASVLIMSHFEYIPGKLRESSLLLGKGKKFSLLDMQKRPGIFMGVELLALSACGTADQERSTDGKEIDGFAELAQRLGARSVVATLWPISDQAAAKIMINFYRQHRDHQDWSKSELLRQTQLNFLRGKVAVNTPTGRHITDCQASDPKARPFIPDPKAPLAHPFYWSAFVLYGGPR
jgi:CHAT domain-containing protein/tetratricopeptide (TPR) repeat protein